MRAFGRRTALHHLVRQRQASRGVNDTTGQAGPPGRAGAGVVTHDGLTSNPWLRKGGIERRPIARCPATVAMFRIRALRAIARALHRGIQRRRREGENYGAMGCPPPFNVRSMRRYQG